MKIAITGHTKNLGHEVYKFFENQGHTVLGFSRTNNYTLPDAIDNIVEQASECDLFFNNAYCDIAQSTFIEKLYDKVPIITSGSIGSYFAYLPNQYYKNKHHVYETHTKCKRLTENPMLLLQIGYLPNYPEKFPVTYQVIIDSITFWLKNPRISMMEFSHHPSIYVKK